MSTPHKDQRITYLQNFYCALLAGVTSRAVTSPLIVIKTLRQVGTKDSQSGYIHTIKSLLKREGIRAFWKGNLIGCLHMFSYSAVNFSAFQYLKLKLANDQGRLSPLCAMLAGAGAATVGTIVVYPLALVKTRLIVQQNKTSYRGILHGLFSIIRTEGIGTFYNGLLVTLLGIVPFTASAFMAYEILDSIHGKPRWQLTPVETLLNGCLATTFAHTVTYPFDTIRKKMQAKSTVLADNGDVDVKFKGSLDCVKQTIGKNGLPGLFRGLTVNVLRFAPQSILLFLVFDRVKKAFLYYNGFTVDPFSATPKPGVDQSLTVEELEEVNLQYQNFKVV